MIFSRIIWHHSAYQSDALQAPLIDGWHKDRGFPISSLGFYIGYHYVIEKDGSVFQARKEDEIGAHDQGENLDSLGICFAGDFSKELPSVAQMKAAATLVRGMLYRNNISLNRIEPHRTDDQTECPGTNLPDNWLIGLL